MYLHEKITFFRNKLNITPHHFAQMIQIKEEELRAYETGERIPTPELLREMSLRLRTNPLYFFESKEKRLVTFPMTYKEFQSWCKMLETRRKHRFIEAAYFEYAIKSDRYFMALKQRYVLRLLDGFYFVPLLVKRYEGDYYQALDYEQMRKVLDEDIVPIERELHKKNVFRLDPDIFAKEVYVSKYDYVDPIYLSDEEETELFDISSHCNHIVGYNETRQVFYLLETNGINEIPLASELTAGILNERDIHLDVQRKKLLTKAEVKELMVYVLKEEAFIRRIQQLLQKPIEEKGVSVVQTAQDVWINLDALEKQDTLNEQEMRAVAHFLRVRFWAIDNIKRMLYLTQEITDSIFASEWRVPEKETKLPTTVHEVQAPIQNPTNETIEHTTPISIMVVDDSTFMRSVISNMLTKHFACIVEEAKDGALAWKQFMERQQQNRPHDLIILDITMPKVDGFTLLKQIMAQDKEATIIMCSSVTNKKIVVESIRNGAKHFITKPIEEDNLIDIVKKVLAKKNKRP